MLDEHNTINSTQKTNLHTRKTNCFNNILRLIEPLMGDKCNCRMAVNLRFFKLLPLFKACVLHLIYHRNVFISALRNSHWPFKIFFGTEIGNELTPTPPWFDCFIHHIMNWKWYCVYSTKQDPSKTRAKANT